MSQIQSTLAAANAPSKPFGDKNSLNELDIDDFLDLMIAEMQNQDPLNPLENDQLLAQISQIREVGATDKLTSTLNAVLLGQNVASATGLIGQQVRALTDLGEPVNGIVDRVTIVDGKPKIQINGEPSTATPTPGNGAIEPGSYNYKVVFDHENPGRTPKAMDLGPATLNESGGITLDNLPITPGSKQIYRTDKSGTGAYYLVAEVDGPTTQFDDRASANSIPGQQLSVPTEFFSSDQTFTVSLENVAEIQLQKDESIEGTP